MILKIGTHYTNQSDQSDVEITKIDGNELEYRVIKQGRPGYPEYGTATIEAFNDWVTQNKLKMINESKFGRAMGKFTDYVSKVISGIKRLGVDENSDLDLQLITHCYAQNMNSRDCASAYLKAYQTKQRMTEATTMPVNSIVHLAADESEGIEEGDYKIITQDDNELGYTLQNVNTLETINLDPHYLFNIGYWENTPKTITHSFTMKESKNILKETSHELPSPKFIVNYGTPDVVRVVKQLINDTEDFKCTRISAVGESQFYNVEITCDMGENASDEIESKRFIIAQKIQKFKADFMSDLAEFLPVVNISLGNYEFTKYSDTLKFSLVILMSQTNQRNWVNGEIKKPNKKNLDKYLKTLDESLNSELDNFLLENVDYVAKPGDELKWGSSLIKVQAVNGAKVDTILNKGGQSIPKEFLTQSLELGVRRGQIQVLS